jgi:hypothetical protein
MNQNASSTRGDSTPLASSFERYLQDKGKGRGGEGGNYRRNSARELQRLHEWATGERGDENWTGITPADSDREPIFADLDERLGFLSRVRGDGEGIPRDRPDVFDRSFSARPLLPEWIFRSSPDLLIIFL